MAGAYAFAGNGFAAAGTFGGAGAFAGAGVGFNEGFGHHHHFGMGREGAAAANLARLTGVADGVLEQRGIQPAGLNPPGLGGNYGGIPAIGQNIFAMNQQLMGC